jgi:hypothetical protein
MVEQDFIDRFKSILEALTQSRGDVSVFALLKMDDVTDKWTVILSAPWINNKDRSDIFFELRDLMIKTLQEDELSLIARFGIFTPSEHLIELLLENFKPGDYIAQDRQINGNLIHEGYILAADRNTIKNLR